MVRSAGKRSGRAIEVVDLLDGIGRRNQVALVRLGR
jgi:hypothetical protein